MPRRSSTIAVTRTNALAEARTNFNVGLRLLIVEATRGPLVNYSAQFVEFVRSATDRTYRDAPHLGAVELREIGVHLSTLEALYYVKAANLYGELNEALVRIAQEGR